MDNYIGQEHLKNAIDSIYKRGATVLIGPDKYGKTFFVQNLAKELKLDYILVESNVENTKALIEEIQPGNLYHIRDLHNARAQVMSRLLKLLEENIPEGAVIVITTEQVNTIDTILSRCLVLKFKRYNINDLARIKELSPMLYKIYDSPTKLQEIDKDVDRVVEFIEGFLADPINYKIGDQSEYDFKLVSNVLICKLAELGYYKVLRRVSHLARVIPKNDYIPGWRAVYMILEDIRYDFI